MESNKEDTANAITELGIATEKLENVTMQKDILTKQVESMKELQAESEKRLNNCYTFGNIMVPLLPAGVIITGACLYANDNYKQIGKSMMMAGAIGLAGIELVYQGGHWLFRVW